MTLVSCFCLLSVGITGGYNHVQVIHGSGDGTQGFPGLSQLNFRPSLGLHLREKHKLQDQRTIPSLYSFLPNFLSCDFGQRVTSHGRKKRHVTQGTGLSLSS